MSDSDKLFLWLFIGFMVILGIGASIAWYAHWADWGAYLLTLVLYGIYLFLFLKLNKN